MRSPCVGGERCHFLLQPLEVETHRQSDEGSGQAHRYQSPSTPARNSPIATTSALSTSRSADDRKGFQRSKIMTTRVRSLRFQASCSYVSSNTTTSPSRQ